MCDTCQDCGCDNITLPVAIGPTGATGATGAAGAAGSAGTTVLHNDVVQSTTTSATKAVFSADKTYTLPIDKLSTNGSKLRIIAIFSTTGATSHALSIAYIELGGTVVQHSSGSDEPYTLAKFDRDSVLRVEIYISRISTTSLFVESQSILFDKNGAGKVLAANGFNIPALAVSDISANTLLIQAKGQTTGTTTFNCDQLTVDHLIK